MTLRIGAHVSIAGGFERAVYAQEAIGGNCGQIFTHSPRSFARPVIHPNAKGVPEFKQMIKEKDIGPWFAHVNYLVNMGSAKPDFWKASVDMMKYELESAATVGLNGIIVHPGSHANHEEGVALVNKALRELEKINPDMWILLEITAGAGSSLGGSWDALGKMISGVKRKNLGVCMDTCHTFAAGYNIADPKELKEMLKKVDSIIGVDKIRAIHLNDSMGKLGEHIDRHEHIGMGQIGEAGMKNILTNPILKKIPLILETNIDKRRGHKENIAEAKRLAGIK